MPGPSDRIPLADLRAEARALRAEIAAARREIGETRDLGRRLMAETSHLRQALGRVGLQVPWIPARALGLGAAVFGTSEIFRQLLRIERERAGAAEAAGARAAIELALLRDISGPGGLAAATAVRAQAMAAEERMRAAVPIPWLDPWRASAVARAGARAAEAMAARERARRLYGARLPTPEEMAAASSEEFLAREYPTLYAAKKYLPFAGEIGGWFAARVYDPLAGQRLEFASRRVVQLAAAAERRRHEESAQWMSRASNVADARRTMWTLRAAREAALREEWDWGDR